MIPLTESDLNRLEEEGCSFALWSC